MGGVKRTQDVALLQLRQRLRGAENSGENAFLPVLPRFMNYPGYCSGRGDILDAASLPVFIRKPSACPLQKFPFLWCESCFPHFAVAFEHFVKQAIEFVVRW